MAQLAGNLNRLPSTRSPAVVRRAKKAFAAKRARAHSSICVLLLLCYSLLECGYPQLVPFGANPTSSQLNWIPHHGRVKLPISGHSRQVKVFAEDLSEEATGDGGEEKGAKVDEGQAVEEGSVEQIPTEEC